MEGYLKDPTPENPLKHLLAKSRWNGPYDGLNQYAKEAIGEMVLHGLNQQNAAWRQRPANVPAR